MPQDAPFQARQRAPAAGLNRIPALRKANTGRQFSLTIAEAQLGDVGEGALFCRRSRESSSPVVRLRTCPGVRVPHCPASAHLLDNEHGLASVVAELRQQERAIWRSRAVVVLLDTLKQRCELQA